MNISKPLALLFLATAFAVASNPSSQGSTVKPPAEGKTIFDPVRSHSYNPYGTAGAASNVRDLVKTPSDINGQSFFYVAPTSNVGYVAFPMAGSFLLGLDQSPLGRPAALVLGYANSSIGFALDYSVAKGWWGEEAQNGSTTGDISQRTTFAGDNIGLYLSMPMGSNTFYANLRWLTYAPSTSYERGSYEFSVNYSEIQGNVGLTHSGSLSYDGYLNIIRTGGTFKDTTSKKYVDPNSYLGAALHFDLGYAALQNSDARVIVGLNNSFSMIFLDEIKTPKRKGDNQMGFNISPNILGEVSLTENWLAFVGATHAINLVAGDRDGVKETSQFTITHSNGTYASVGVRYQKTNWAVEATLENNIFDNPLDGLNGNDMLSSFGGFINF